MLRCRALAEANLPDVPEIPRSDLPPERMGKTRELGKMTRYFGRTTPPTIEKPGALINKYCSKCLRTTQHRVAGDGINYACLRCEKLKEYPSFSGTLEKLEDRLSIALGLMEAVDKPELQKPEGEQKKSKEGAHRPDEGVKFVQMRYDDQFQTKANYRKLQP